MAHNSIYRGAYLGSISSLNEYLAFRSAHGIDDGSYKDLYIGDTFYINDGTYNVPWVVAHFNYYYDVGNYGSGGTTGVILMTKARITTSKMYATAENPNGFVRTIPATTVCPAIATALQTVFGSYLLDFNPAISTELISSIPSMAGMGMNGATTKLSWGSAKCLIPTEIQVYGSQIYSSSANDSAEASNKFALFNFINHVTFDRNSFWLRNACSDSHYCMATGEGRPNEAAVNNELGIRPYIYIN